MFEQILASAKVLGEEGETISPDLIRAAAEVAGAQAASHSWDGKASSLADAGEVRTAFRQVGAGIAELFAPGGALEGSTIDQSQAAQPEVGLPTASGSEVETWRSVKVTAGGCAQGTWAAVSRKDIVKGRWELMQSERTGALGLGFWNRQGDGLFRVPAAEINAVAVRQSGINTVLDVSTRSGVPFVVVAPRKRLREIFTALGHQL